MSLLNGMLACCTCLACWRALRALRAGVLHVLTDFKRWHAGRALKNSVLDNLKLMKCFLDVFDHGALVNCALY